MSRSVTLFSLGRIFNDHSPFTITANMDSMDLVPLIEQLDDNIDDLEEALLPFIKGALSDTAGTLPLLDKAQLYVLITYGIESIIFCSWTSHQR